MPMKRIETKGVLMNISGLTKDDIINHIRKHHRKYLAGLLAVGGLAGGYAARHKLQEKFNNLKSNHFKSNPSLLSKTASHIIRNKETYGGAALGSLSSYLSNSHDPSIKSRFKKAALSGVIGGMTGKLIRNRFDNTRLQDEIRHNKELFNVKSK